MRWLWWVAVVAALSGAEAASDDADPNLKCWSELFECNIDGHYKCSGEEYDAYLRRHKCPERLTQPMLPANTHLLIFGPSYIGQIFKALACVHDRSKLIVDIHPPPTSEKDRFVQVRLSNNATMMLIVNNEAFQTTATFFKNFPKLLFEHEFTHAMFMEPHPDCHFNHERCVPIGDNVVADRAPILSELIMQCAYRSAFATHFGVNGKKWMHVLAWAGLFSRGNLMHGELRTCEQNLLADDTSPSGEPVLFDMREYIDAERCSVSSCTSKGSGHQCSPGGITTASIIAVQKLLGVKDADTPHVTGTVNRRRLRSHQNASWFRVHS